MRTVGIEFEVAELLEQKKLHVTTAESCTGGLIAKKVTDVSGASSVFNGGVVSYVNAVKNVVLGVSASDLEKYGAVSETVARQMAAGVRLLLHTDIAVSTTGVAGPDKDDRGNDVGTVYISLATAEQNWCYLCHFEGSRSRIRTATADFGLPLGGRYLAGAGMNEGAL